MSGDAYLYARFGTPSSARLESSCAARLDAAWAVVVASGMAAIDAAITSCLMTSAPSDNRVVAYTKGIYVGARRYFERIVPYARGARVIEVPFLIDGKHVDIFRTCMESLRPHVLFTESFSNPLIEQADIPAMAEICREMGCRLIVDATLGPPPNRSPLNDGADFVLHSATKYFGAGNDVLAGIVAGRADELRQVCYDYRRFAGAVLDDASCEKLLHDLGDLESRFTVQAKNASHVAHFIRGRPDVREVYANPSAALVTFEFAASESYRSEHRSELFFEGMSPGIPFSASFGSPVTTIVLVGLLDRSFEGRPMFRISAGSERWTDIRKSLERGFVAASLEGR